MERMEQLAAMVYKNWKKRNGKTLNIPCPDEETLACFKEGILSKREEQELKLHLLKCASCSENIILDGKIKAAEIDAPEDFIQAAKDLVKGAEAANTLEVILRLKEKFLEVIKTTADLLKTKESGLQPVLLRGRTSGQFSEEVQLIKYFSNLKVLVRIEKTRPDMARVSITLTVKNTDRPADNLRVTLLKDNQETESYIAKQGSAVFSNISVGRYKIEISDVRRKLGKISLELR